MSFSAVECIKCGTLHKEESKTYLRFLGNVYVGQDGGIVGDNFIDTPVTSTYFCPECFIQYLLESKAVDRNMLLRLTGEY